MSSTTLANSGEETESNWVSSVLGYTVTFADRTECSCSWQSVDGSTDWFALDFGLDAPATTWSRLATAAASTQTRR